MYSIRELYDLSHTIAADYLKGFTFPWEALGGIKELIRQLGEGLSPEELLILSDEQKEFRQKMSRVLSDFEFKVMTMYMDGMTCAEICEATGKSPKSVDNALQRSKRKLLQMILEEK